MHKPVDAHLNTPDNEKDPATCSCPCKCPEALGLAENRDKQPGAMQGTNSSMTYNGERLDLHG